VSQQGFPPGRHSRGPHPGEAPYGDENPYRDEVQYPDEVQYGDEVQHPAEATPYRDPYGDQVPYQDAPQSSPGLRPGGDRGARPSRGAGPGGARPDRSRRADRQRPHRPAWEQIDPFGQGPDTDADLPAWAAPAGYTGRPTGTLRRPLAPRRHEDVAASGSATDADLAAPQPEAPAEEATRLGRRRGRAAATRLRKSRRRVYRLGGAAIAACIVAAGIVAIVMHHSPAPAPYVTSLQHGEFTSVPSACSAVSTSVLDQYLPGSGRTSTNTQSSRTNSQCSFTIDTKPNFLVLEVQAQSFEPFAAAARDGSATGNAQDNFAIAQLGLAHPPKKSPLPPAQISKVTGLGQQAFMAFQAAHVSGIATDIVTVVIRERNVVVTASLSGQESGHGFGPVPVATLEAGARAAAQSVLAKVMTQPTA
jgi:hypothetical protein